MDFATIFRLEENLNLDKKTLVFLRWIAIFGQVLAIFFVSFVIKIQIPIFETLSIILLSIVVNFYCHINFIFFKKFE